MTGLEILPDGGEVLRLALKDRDELAPLATSDGTTVADRIPIALTLAGDGPCIRYANVSDAAGRYGEGLPLVQVECWGRKGPDDGSASLLARTAAALVEHLGIHAGVEAGPYQSNDPNTGRARWIFTVRLHTFAG